MTQTPAFNIAFLRKILEDATAPDAKWNSRSLSMAATGGKNPYLVRDIIKGKSTNPTLDTLVGLARALDMDISQMIPAATTIMHRVGGSQPFETLEVVGAVAAGVWREETTWGAEDRYSIEVGPNPFPGSERFALRMEGYSMDKVIPPGSDLECLRVAYGYVEPQPGDIVIVQRDRHDLHELTCKRLDHDGQNFILRGESTRAEFQEPIVIGRPDENHVGDNDITIIAIVLRAHQSLYTRRR
ncbi:S24 family peptidase [Sphingomonas sp. C3-2]|uniref:S24 family peptidase n=1 Tax=Sphingomonas sp. C3-2 TaxID=3062169 RepID=UPI00294B744A|nr:S24 family peptidase [Sphingomonas sp. C3-2]WOK37591.1 S24 family peptidase [Sphingomonas sp. C3-2]